MTDHIRDSIDQNFPPEPPDDPRPEPAPPPDDALMMTTNQPPDQPASGVDVGRDAEFWFTTGGEGKKRRRDRYTGIVIGRQPGKHEIRSHDLGGRVLVPDKDVIGEVQ